MAIIHSIHKGRGTWARRGLACCLCSFLALFASCSLDEDPRNQIPEEKAYTTGTALYRNTVATLYNYVGGNADGQGLQGTCRGIHDLQTFSSDEALIPVRGGDWFDGGIWQQMYRHTWPTDHEFINNSWLYLYKVITLCNRSMEKLEQYKGLAGSDYVLWQAEVRALRAMYYWYLMDLFGDVPLITSSKVSMKDVTRESRAKVFLFCVEELEAARSSLPRENSTREGDYYGRVTMPVCDFILAKLMLNAAVYTGVDDATEYYRKCIGYCDRLSGFGYRLESDYENNFKVYNEHSTENIFVIPMDKYIYSNHFEYLSRSLHYRHAAAYDMVGENGTCATKRTLQIFGYNTPEEDRRFALNYFGGVVRDKDNVEIPDRTGKPLRYVPEAVEEDLSGSPYVETAGARMGKYEMDKNSINTGKIVDNDIVLFRYADVLLMRAEALVRLGEDGSDDFNKVRARVNMPKRECTLQNILDERLLELCWEGWRRQDLIRFGQFKSLYDGPDAIDESDGHTTIFPIPADVCVINPNIKQNPKY